MGFYMVVCGWTLEYIWQSVSGKLATVTDFSANFAALQQDHLKQTLLMTGFTVLTLLFTLSGVRKELKNHQKYLCRYSFYCLFCSASGLLRCPVRIEGL